MVGWLVISGTGYRNWYRRTEVEGSLVRTPDEVLKAIPNDEEYHCVTYKDGSWYVDGEWICGRVLNDESEELRE